MERSVSPLHIRHPVLPLSTLASTTFQPVLGDDITEPELASLHCWEKGLVLGVSRGWRRAFRTKSLDLCFTSEIRRNFLRLLVLNAWIFFPPSCQAFDWQFLCRNTLRRCLRGQVFPCKAHTHTYQNRLSCSIFPCTFAGSIIIHARM